MIDCPPLPDKRFDILYADPPWDYNGQTFCGRDSRPTGGVHDHYPTIKADALAALPVRGIAKPDCLLFMWATGPILDQCIEVGKAWGFKWATVAFVWDKIISNPGYYTLSQTEFCLVFKRGSIPKSRAARNVRQLIRCQRGQHSEKPLEVRARIDRMFPRADKCEMFARPRESLFEDDDSWTLWGNEA